MNGAGTGARTRSLRLNGSEGAVGRCREFGRRALLDWHWLPAPDEAVDGEWDEERLAAADDVLLMISELVTNACLHAGGPLELRLRCTPARLRVEVLDASPVVPRLRPLGEPGRPGGHGLRVVSRLARSWGTEPVDGGKAVWLEVAAPLGVLVGER
ncbi:ATP-binding protein [Kitasatospora sp. NPDC004240]